MLKNVLNFIKSRLDVAALFIVWLIVTIFNLRGYWMLVDDGEGVVFARTLFEKLASLNLVAFFSQLLETNGRFRPVYWIYHMVVWFIGRNSYQFHHFAHMVVIGVGALFVYLIIKELTRSKWHSFFGSLFFLLTPLNTENIFRLGPQEPLLVAFLGFLFYLLIVNKKVVLPAIILALAVFTKETSIAMFPLIFFYYVFGRQSKIIKNKKQGYYLWLSVCASVAAMVVITLLRRGGYSTNYSFDMGMMVSNLIGYTEVLVKYTSYIFPLIPLIYIGRMGMRLLGKRNIFATKLDLFEFLFLGGFVLFLGIQLPWKYALTRYLMPAGFFLTLFLFIEISVDLKILENVNFVKKYRRLLTVTLFAIAVYAFLFMGLDVILKATSGVSNYNAFKKMSEYPQNTILLMNMRRGDSTIELVYETGVHLSEFWGRPDIKVEYLYLQNLPKGKYVVVDSDQFPRAYPQNELNLRYGTRFSSLDLSSKRLVMTTPLELIKQTIKKLFAFIVRKEQFTSEGLYTYYFNNNGWHFYHENN